MKGENFKNLRKSNRDTALFAELNKILVLQYEQYGLSKLKHVYQDIFPPKFE